MFVTSLNMVYMGIVAKKYREWIYGNLFLKTLKYHDMNIYMPDSIFLA